MHAALEAESNLCPGEGNDSTGRMNSRLHLRQDEERRAGVMIPITKSFASGPATCSKHPYGAHALDAGSTPASGSLFQIGGRMRSWQRDLAIADAKMRAEYFRRLIEVAQIPAALARIHTNKATIETMKLYLEADNAKSE